MISVIRRQGMFALMAQLQSEWITSDYVARNREDYHTKTYSNAFTHPLRPIQKSLQMLYVLLTLVNMRKVRCIVQCDPLGLFNVFKEGSHCHILSLIVHCIHQKGWYFDLV